MMDLKPIWVCSKLNGLTTTHVAYVFHNNTCTFAGLEKSGLVIEVVANSGSMNKFRSVRLSLAHQCQTTAVPDCI